MQHSLLTSTLHSTGSQTRHHLTRPNPKLAVASIVALSQIGGGRGPRGNCIKIGFSGKSILRDYFQENRISQRPFLLLKISFPGRPIFIQFIPEHVDDEVECRVDGEHQVRDGHDPLDARVLLGAPRVAHALGRRRVN